MRLNSFILIALTLADSVPMLEQRPAVPDELFKQMIQYSMAAGCQSVIQNSTWSCGDRCGGILSNITVFKTYTHEGTDAAAYITRDDDTKSLVVAFRGSKSATNYFMDAKFFKKKVDWINATDVQVHSGFADTYFGVRSEIQQDLQTLARSLDYDIYFTGHSLGGAVAILAAADFHVETPTRRVKVVTFGQPRVGNKEFGEYVEALGIPIQRVIADGDVVPSLPPTWLGYQHIGNGFEIINGTTYECGSDCKGSGKIDFKQHGVGYYGWNSDIPAVC